MNNPSSKARKLEKLEKKRKLEKEEPEREAPENEARREKQRRIEKEAEKTLLGVERMIMQDRLQQDLDEKRLQEVADDLQRCLADKRTGAFNLFFPPDNDSPDSVAELYCARYAGKRECDWAWTVSKADVLWHKSIPKGTQSKLVSILIAKLKVSLLERTFRILAKNPEDDTEDSRLIFVRRKSRPKRPTTGPFFGERSIKGLSLLPASLGIVFFFDSSVGSIFPSTSESDTLA